MNFFIQVFNTILYQPLVNLLILLYTYLPGHDFGIAVIVLTLIVKLILLPFSLKAMKSQKSLALLQPKIQEIKERYKNDRQAQAKAMLELYQKGKASPAAGCLPLLLQLPILIALYQVFLKGLKPEALTPILYSFVPNPGEIILTFLGFINLAKPNLVLAILAGGAQFLQTKLSMQPEKTQKEKGKSKKGDFASMMQSQMLYIFPVFVVFLVWQLGSVIGLYWLASTLFSIGEQYIIKRQDPRFKSQN